VWSPFLLRKEYKHIAEGVTKKSRIGNKETADWYNYPEQLAVSNQE
jgi:hypothetical protein